MRRELRKQVYQFEDAVKFAASGPCGDDPGPKGIKGPVGQIEQKVNITHDPTLIRCPIMNEALWNITPPKQRKAILELVHRQEKEKEKQENKTRNEIDMKMLEKSFAKVRPTSIHETRVKEYYKLVGAEKKVTEFSKSLIKEVQEEMSELLKKEPELYKVTIQYPYFHNFIFKREEIKIPLCS